MRRERKSQKLEYLKNYKSFLGNMKRNVLNFCFLLVRYTKLVDTSFKST